MTRPVLGLLRRALAPVVAALLFAAQPAAAVSGPATPTGLIAQFLHDLPDNTKNLITPAQMRADLGYIVNSMAYLLQAGPGQILIGSTASVLTPQAVSGDCALSSSGAILCTKTNGVAFGAGATATPSALTKANDTNVTLTLGGSPAVALLGPVSLTLGWTGNLAVPRGGTGQASFTANLPVLGNGSSGLTQGTRSGNTTSFATTSGTLTNGHCPQWDGTGNLVDSGGVCGGGGGSGTVSAGTAGQLAYYAGTGTAVSGSANDTISAGALTLGQGGSVIGQLALANTTSGVTTLTPGATAPGTLTLPGGTDQLVGRATTDTLTNKTLTAPTITGGTAAALTGLGIRSSGSGAFDLTLANTENLSAGRTLTLAVNDAARTLTIAGNATVSGTNTGDQTITLTGDVTGSGTAGITTALANIPTGTPAVGSILHTNIAAPSTPASGKDAIYADSSDLRLHDKNAAGVIGTTVVSDTGAANNFVTGITTAGAITKAQPNFSNLSGQTTLAQLPSIGASTFLCNATTGASVPTACNTTTSRTTLGIANNNVKVATPAAKGDAIILIGASTTAGSNVINDSLASFVSGDAGKLVSVTYQNTITVTVASPAVLTWTSHGLAAGDVITLFSSGALPTGLTAGTPYYVIAGGLTANAFELAVRPGGTAINTTGTQSGAHFAISSAGFNGTIAAVLSSTSVQAGTNVTSTSSNAQMIYGTNDTAAFIAAAAASPLSYAPSGNYMISSAVTFQAANGAGINGDGTGNTNVYIASVTAKGFVFQSGAYPQMHGVHVTRIGTAQAGATNVDVSASTLHGDFNGLFLEHGYDNIVLGGTQFGSIQNVTTQSAISNGMHLTNATSGEPLQWQLDNIIAGLNGASGFLTACDTGTGATLGNWRNVETFSDGNYGVDFQGKAGCPVGDIRLTNLFVGNDYLGEVFLDTFGGTALIQGTSWAEGSTAGACINQTSNTGHVSIQGMTLNTCNQQGVLFSGSTFELNGGNILGNGGAAVFVGAGTSGTITNARISGNGVGVFITSTAGVAVTNNNLLAQTTPVTPGTGTGNRICGNLGYDTSTCGPLLIGGVGVASTLSLQSTTGVGVGADAINMLVGNNGGTHIGTFTTTGLGIGAGATTPGNYLDIVDSNAGVMRAQIWNTNAGASAQAVMQLQTTAGIADFVAPSTAGGSAFNESWTGSGPTQFLAQNATGSFTWYTGASPALKATLNTTGDLILTSATTSTSTTTGAVQIAGGLGVVGPAWFGGVLHSGAGTGVSCSGTPTASFASINGLVTHC